MAARARRTQPNIASRFLNTSNYCGVPPPAPRKRTMRTPNADPLSHAPELSSGASLWDPQGLPWDITSGPRSLGKYHLVLGNHHPLDAYGSVGIIVGDANNTGVATLHRFGLNIPRNRGCGIAVQAGVCSVQSVVFSGGVHQSPVRVSSVQNAEMPQQKHLFRQGLLGEGGANYFWSRNSALLNIEVVLRRASIQSYSQ
jgi:hypothetical protein